MKVCLSCKFEHPPVQNCKAAAYARRQLVANDPIAVVANNEVCGEMVANVSRHGKYADAERRRVYMRELMRARRVK